MCREIDNDGLADSGLECPNSPSLKVALLTLARDFRVDL